jgi:hypothetical protein
LFGKLLTEREREKERERARALARGEGERERASERERERASERERKRERERERESPFLPPNLLHASQANAHAPAPHKREPPQYLSFRPHSRVPALLKLKALMH